MPITHTCTCGKVAEIDAVPQAAFKERLDSMAAQRDGFKNDAAQAAIRLREVEAQAATWKASHEELQATRAQAEQDAAFTAAGLNPAVASPHARAYLQSQWEAVPSAEAAPRPSFADWLKAQTAAPDPDIMILGLRAKVASLASTPAGAAPPVPRPPVVLPPPPAGAAPPPPPDPKTAAAAAARAAAAAGHPLTPEEFLSAAGIVVKKT